MECTGGGKDRRWRWEGGRERMNEKEGRREGGKEGWRDGRGDDGMGRKERGK